MLARIVVYSVIVPMVQHGRQFLSFESLGNGYKQRRPLYLRRVGCLCFAFLQQSEVNLEMILQLNLYIMKQIPYLHLKIVYHLFYSINLELKLDGLEFNSQNI